MKSLPTLNKRRKIIYFVPGVLLVVFAAVFARVYRVIISEDVTSWTRDITADCAVVLTGGPHRVREGFDLLARGQVKKLIISGVNANSQLREIMPMWTFYGDLSEKDVVLDRRSTTTYGNVQQTLPLVEALQCRDVALITSNLHMERAYRTFKGAFPDDIVLYRHSVAAGQGEASPWEISTEVLKSLFYSIWAY